jgi:hypothetical protein
MKHLNKKNFMVILIGLSMLVSIFAAVQNIGYAQAKKQHEVPINILILTNQDDKKTSAPYVSLNLDDRISITTFGASDDTNDAIKALDIKSFQVIVLDCYLPQDIEDQNWLRDQVTTNNLGILLFGGNYTMGLESWEAVIPAYFTIDRENVNATMYEGFLDPLGFDDLPNQNYLNQVYANTSEFEIMDDQIQVAVSDEEDAKSDEKKLPFSSNIAWQSCPLLRERVSTYAKKDKAQTIVEVPNTKEPLMVTAKVKDISPIVTESSVIFISTGVGMINKTKDDGTMSESMMNKPFSLWPYFNYLMYLCAYYLTISFDNSLLETYADWPWSPIPHEREATLWMIFVASLWVFNFVLFFTLGKKKKAKEAQEGSVKTPSDSAIASESPKPESPSGDPTPAPADNANLPKTDYKPPAPEDKNE